jgi:ABC-type dipeptide/oligopeptide/nickel transport system permease subunit
MRESVPIAAAGAMGGTAAGRRRLGPGLRALRQFMRHRMAVAGAVYLIVTVAVALGAPLVSPYGYARQDLLSTYAPASAQHWFGTDALGRDVLSRLIYGARVSMSVGLAGAVLVLLIGVPVGLVAGYVGGKFDLLLMRVVDTVYAIPYLLLVILLQVFFTAFLPTIKSGPLHWVNVLNVRTGGVTAIVVALALVGWLDVARIVRGQTLAVRGRDFVLSAHGLGASDGRIMRLHLLPNVAAAIVVAATLLVPQFVIAEAGLSFLGLGVQPPTPSWGTMIADGVDAIESYPRLMIAPGLVLALTLLSLNFVGDGLRDALDPTMRQ